MRICSFLMISALTLVLPAGPILAAHDHAAHGSSPEKAAESVYTAKGKVTLVEKNVNKVTIHHEPVPVLKWPDMVMPFRVEDASLLDGLKKGDSVRLDFKVGGPGKDPVIVDIEVLK